MNHYPLWEEPAGVRHRGGVDDRRATERVRRRRSRASLADGRRRDRRVRARADSYDLDRRQRRVPVCRGRGYLGARASRERRGATKGERPADEGAAEQHRRAGVVAAHAGVAEVPGARARCCSASTFAAACTCSTKSTSTGRLPISRDVRNHPAHAVPRAEHPHRRSRRRHDPAGRDHRAGRHGTCRGDHSPARRKATSCSSSASSRAG